MIERILMGLAAIGWLRAAWSGRPLGFLRVAAVFAAMDCLTVVLGGHR